MQRAQTRLPFGLPFIKTNDSRPNLGLTWILYHAHEQPNAMRFRMNILLACLAGSVVASLAGLLIAVKFDAGLLSLVFSVSLPTLACYYAGLKTRNYLGAIAIYAAVGWMVGTMLTPAVAMGPSSQLQKIIESQFAGHDHILPCVILSSTLAVSRSFFVKPGTNTATLETDDRG